jgi:GrpB-like predicted nucleotidyltransferase (UPF0157 family)
VPEPVVIVDYSPGWPAEFDQLHDCSVRSVGELTAVVEHIGSTSVPGCAAKPIVDLDVVVSGPELVADAVARLETIGYAHEGDLGIDGRQTFLWPPGEPKHHLYVVVEGGASHRAHVQFRDHLRTHPNQVADYVELKRRLASQHGSDRDGYTAAKTALIERVLADARA